MIKDPLSLLNLPFPGALSIIRERFSDTAGGVGAEKPSVGGMVVSIALGLVAGSLSYYTSSCLGVSTGLTIFYVIVAYVFSWLYIIIWLIFYRNACAKAGAVAAA